MKPANFLDLPAELRNAIYLEVINTTPKEIITLKAEGLKDTTKQPPRARHYHHLALLRTTKQVYLETLPIFLANHRIRIAETAWPRVLSIDSYINSIIHLIIDKSTTASITTALTHASILPNLTTLDIRISNFRFARAKPYLEKGFPVLRKLYISDPKLKALMEHLALEEVWNGEEMVTPSSRIHTVADFQTWRGCWDKLVSLRMVDRELKREAEERMAKMVGARLF